MAVDALGRNLKQNHRDNSDGFTHVVIQKTSMVISPRVEAINDERVKSLMNMIHEQVVHRQFGIGSIIEQVEKIVRVKFSDEVGIKMFEYPFAFDKYLIFCNVDLQDKIGGEIREEVRLITEQIETVRKHKEEEYQKRKEEERIKNLALKQTVPRKRASAKSGKKST
ncbi:MAG: hypothetical protein H6Q67_832 [Firmicutes bacterium]|nr:hypothetical protein [Bacillota bacterium]